MFALLHHINPLYSLSGLFVGALVGVTGVGGGSLMTPLLVLLFGIHPATAVGTDLLYAGLTKGNEGLKNRGVKALMMTAVLLLFRRWLLGTLARYSEALSPGQVARLTVTLGAVLGVLVSISSVGAGAIGVTVLILLYPKLPVARLVGSDIAHAVPLTLIAGTGHWLIGSVDWPLLGSLLVGSIPGIIIGSQVASYIPDRVLRPILASTLAAVGARLAF